ncbi:signal recognition particle 9 kDa protein-domain-containing protein [Xylariomycetidae sp. FL2044]|nr:signal recognition particle 9 kDa protein-domain-containing protein [Xylariomycetidae sp. FL2044]
MPYYATSQEWLHQSSLLLQARPTTTRITTKYHITKPSTSTRRSKKSQQQQQQQKIPVSTSTETAPPAKLPLDQVSSSPSSSSPQATVTTRPPRGSLVLKTYDPASGVVLKYRTTKAAEVSRLILSFGRLGRRMAGLPEGEDADVVMGGAGGGGDGAEEKEKEAPATASAVETPGKGQQGQGQGQGQSSGGGSGGGGGGKGKKKRGKK